MSGIPPWFVALCILIVVCAIGASIVYSFKGLPEGFTSESCESYDDDCGIPQYTEEPEKTVSLFPGMDQNIAVSSTPLAYSTPADTVSTDAKFKNLLQAIQQRTGSSSIFPTTSSLHMVSGRDASGSAMDASGSAMDASGSTYVPNQVVIAPHQYPPASQPTLTANAPTDAGTMANEITNGAFLTPSVRQMIRSDVKNAIKDQVDELQNQYEITYEQQ